MNYACSRILDWPLHALDSPTAKGELRESISESKLVTDGYTTEGTGNGATSTGRSKLEFMDGRLPKSMFGPELSDQWEKC
ncbi:hypothetical protein KY285_025385 [Solanum tuberosum]|nr:hypothetical protein KY285_025385 [Solanum tuberosum]